MATAEFSKFAGILSAALSQHHLLEFEKTQLEFHHLHLLRNLYADQEATVRTGHGKTDWFQIGKGVHQRLNIVTLLI